MAALQELIKTKTSKHSTLWFICKFCNRAYLDADLLWEHKKSEHYDLMVSIKKEKERQSEMEYDDESEDSSNYSDYDQPDGKRAGSRKKCKIASTSAKQMNSTKAKAGAKETVSPKSKNQNGRHLASTSKNQHGSNISSTSKNRHGPNSPSTSNGLHSSLSSQGSTRIVEPTTSTSQKESATRKARSGNVTFTSEGLKSSRDPLPSTSKGLNRTPNSVPSSSRGTTETRASKHERQNDLGAGPLKSQKTEPRLGSRKPTVLGREGVPRIVATVKGRLAKNDVGQDRRIANQTTTGVQTVNFHETSTEALNITNRMESRKKVSVVDNQAQTTTSVPHDASTETTADETKSTAEFSSQTAVDVQDQETQVIIQVRDQFSQSKNQTRITRATNSESVCRTETTTQTEELSKAEAAVGTPSVCTVEVGITCDIRLPQSDSKFETPMEPDSLGKTTVVDTHQEFGDSKATSKLPVVNELPQVEKLFQSELTIDSATDPVNGFKYGIEKYTNKHQNGNSKSGLELFPIPRVRADTDIFAKLRRYRDKLPKNSNCWARSFRKQFGSKHPLLVGNSTVKNLRRKRATKSPCNSVVKTELPDDQPAGLGAQATTPVETLQPTEPQDEPEPKKVFTQDSTHAKFDCWICSQSFAEITDLEIHMKETHLLFSLKLFGCPECKSAYSTVETLRTHLITVHKLVGLDISTAMSRFRYSCDPCGKLLRYPGYVHHMRTVHMINLRKDRLLQFSCDICKKTFSTKAGLVYHRKTHTRIRERLNCLDCPKSFSSPAGLRYHRSISHDSNLSTSAVSTGNSLPSSTSDMKPFRKSAQVSSQGQATVKTERVKHTGWLLCQSCGFKCKAPSRLKCHLETKHPDFIHDSPSTEETSRQSQPDPESIRKPNLQKKAPSYVKVALRKKTLSCEPITKKVLRRKSSSSETDSKKRPPTRSSLPKKATPSKPTGKQTPIKKSSSSSPVSRATSSRKRAAATSGRSSQRLAVTTNRRATRASMPMLPRHLK